MVVVGGGRDGFGGCIELCVDGEAVKLEIVVVAYDWIGFKLLSLHRGNKMYSLHLTHL